MCSPLPPVSSRNCQAEVLQEISEAESDVYDRCQGCPARVEIKYDAIGLSG